EGFDLEVTLEDGKLMTKATGQAKFQIFAESETRFFVKAFDAAIEFQKSASGEVDSAVLYQAGNATTIKRKKD
ncbi:MAG: DUF3471 domain-containing protein, partial [Bacteroidota bacterium]